MDTRLKDIVSRENRNVLFAFIGTQIFNIIVTFFIAWLMFGVVKPALWPTEVAEVKVEAPKPVVAAPQGMTIPVEPAATESDVDVIEYERLIPSEMEE